MKTIIITIFVLLPFLLQGQKIVLTTTDSTKIECNQLVSISDSVYLCKNTVEQDGKLVQTTDTIFKNTILSIDSLSNHFEEYDVVENITTEKGKYKRFWSLSFVPSISIPIEQSFGIAPQETGYSEAGTGMEINFSYFLLPKQHLGFSLNAGRFMNKQDIFSISSNYLGEYEIGNIYFDFSTGAWQNYYLMGGFVFGKSFLNKLFLKTDIFAGAILQNEPYLTALIIDKNNIAKNISNTSVTSINFGFKINPSFEYRISKRTWVKFYGSLIGTQHNYKSPLKIEQNGAFTTQTNNYTKKTIVANIGVGLTYTLNYE